MILVYIKKKGDKDMNVAMFNPILDGDRFWNWDVEFNTSFHVAMELQELVDVMR